MKINTVFHTLVIFMALLVLVMPQIVIISQIRSLYGCDR